MFANTTSSSLTAIQSCCHYHENLRIYPAKCASIKSKLWSECNKSRFCLYSDYVGIACERCIGTFMPLRYPQIITTSRVRVALLLSITLPVVVILPGFALSNRWQGDLPCLYFVVFPPWLSCVTCGWVLFCIVFMMGAYLCILHTTMKLQQRVKCVYHLTSFRTFGSLRVSIDDIITGHTMLENKRATVCGYPPYKVTGKQDIFFVIYF